jgi:hypothetical protein
MNLKVRVNHILESISLERTENNVLKITTMEKICQKYSYIAFGLNKRRDAQRDKNSYF